MTTMLRIIILFFLLPTPAFAYLDPGTGSIVAQVVIAGILGILFQGKMLWRRFKSWTGALYHRRHRDSE